MTGYSLVEGLRVLEVAQLAPSSVGGQLADLGAEVIKVETVPGDGVRFGGAYAVGGPDGPGFMHLRWNRGKKSVLLDLRSESGRESFLDLARGCDALIEGTRAGYLEHLGLGYDVIRQRNPTLVWCTVSGTGIEGPYSRLASGGLWFDAYAGLRTVDTDQPSPPGVMGGSAEAPIAMYAVGAYGALGVLAAVFRAQREGIGARLEVCSVDIAAQWVPDRIDQALNHDRVVRRAGWTVDGRLPDWPRLEAYATEDGGAMIFGAHLDKFWRRFCDAVERPDLLEFDLVTVDQDLDRRARHVRSELVEIFAQRTRQEWTELFLANDIAGGPVNSVDELLDDPHFRARAGTYTAVHPGGTQLELTSTPIRVLGEEFAPTLAPELGADTDEVMRLIAGLRACDRERHDG